MGTVNTLCPKLSAERHYKNEVEVKVLCEHRVVGQLDVMGHAKTVRVC